MRAKAAQISDFRKLWDVAPTGTPTPSKYKNQNVKSNLVQSPRKHNCNYVEVENPRVIL